MSRWTQWRAWVLAILVTWGSVAAADDLLSMPRERNGSGWNDQTMADVVSMAPSDRKSSPSIFLVSDNADAAETGLAERIAELEKTVKAMKDKEAAAKEKAAGAPTIQPGGRFQVDWASFSQNANSLSQAGDFRNGTEFRRARLSLEGDAFQIIEYQVEVEFVGLTEKIFQQTTFKDLYFTVKELPWLGNVIVGHFKEPFGLEENTSVNYITFMERAMSNVFDPGRSIGVMALNHLGADENMMWRIGAFATLVTDAPAKSPFGPYDDAGGTALTMRYIYLPWYDETSEGRGYLHTGIGYTYRDVPEVLPGEADRFQLKVRPEAHMAGYVADTGTMSDTSTINAANAEMAWIYGPVSLQSEYTGYWINRTDTANPMFHGGYLQASWFLTGEHRPYDRSTGRFTRIRPFENFFRVRTEDGNVATGKGAWELAYRCSYLDLTDAGVRGGQVVDHTLGLNWYLNPYTRVMWNYVHSDTSDYVPPGRPDTNLGVASVDVFQMRAQFDF